ncbi:MAG: diacylglycerol kinase family lipid kinase [Deltaproteobacteria bacterium]|nr:diacylglycerol kinase family lipid kinase [Deltaproteobacteria bacterium]
MPSPRTVVVVNPNSQGGNVGRRWSYFADQIRRELPFEEALTSGPGDATRLTREALRSGADRVVALGGDGTVNEVVNGFFENGERIAPSAAFGFLPCGTGGDFRKTLGVSNAFATAVACLAADKRRRIDVGRIDHANAGGGTGVRMFANIASFGMSGVVDRALNGSKKRFGSLSFFWATTKTTLRYTNQRVSLRCDDDDPIDLTINTVAVANGQFFGGGMQIAPNAALDDGLFDVVSIGDVGIRELVMNSRRLYKGTHLELPKISHRRARVVTAEAVTAGDVVELDVDGETPGILPAKFSIVDRALEVVAP